ncbi:MAG: 4Fe-4S binding protein [Thermoplasmata archaeon]|nr:4Fe-4S binding protein [Thermoplasmata archaeon]
MKQLTVISGKGGTGKTTIVAAFASLAKDAVLADCDVDAPDLHLILKPTVEMTHDFSGMNVARNDKDKCISCGKCLEHCRFNAITHDYDILPHKCEGCGVCEYVCPVGAISLVERKSGAVYRSNTRFGPMVHALLNIGEEASGKLVTVVRNTAEQVARESDKDVIIVDGPPGIGCPVISAITGVDLVLVVTEPTLSGMHDMKRILGVADHFNIPAVVCVNKYDINTDNAEGIEKYCSEREVDVVGKLPYDNAATQAMIAEKTLIEFTDKEIALETRKLWERVRDRLV